MKDKEAWDNCGPFTQAQTNPTNGDYPWTATENGTHYLACGVGDGYHCKYGGLKAKITVPCP